MSTAEIIKQIPDYASLTAAEVRAALLAERVAPLSGSDRIWNYDRVRADYLNGSVLGPLRFKITAPGILAGDTVRFGAKRANQPSILALGQVAEVNGEFVGIIELNRTDHTNRKDGEWRWEFEHLDGNGKVSPLIVDQKLKLLPSRADPIM
jgi:hypothetical protein